RLAPPLAVRGLGPSGQRIFVTFLHQIRATVGGHPGPARGTAVASNKQTATARTMASPDASSTAAPGGPGVLGRIAGARRWLAAWIPFLPLGLRARLALLVVVAGLPALLLFLLHAQSERAQLVAEAEARALRLARAWADNHDALLREAHL